MTSRQANHDYTDHVKKELPDYMRDAGYVHECPDCQGYGGWVIKRNDYGLPDGMADTAENRAKYSHFCASCFQCMGWGYVRDEDKDCVHDFHEISADEARKRGAYHGGACYHVVACSKCDRISAYDSSD